MKAKDNDADAGVLEKLASLQDRVNSMTALCSNIHFSSASTNRPFHSVRALLCRCICELRERRDQRTARSSNIGTISNPLHAEIFETHDDHNIVNFNHNSDGIENSCNRDCYEHWCEDENSFAAEKDQTNNQDSLCINFPTVSRFCPIVPSLCARCALLYVCYAMFSHVPHFFVFTCYFLSVAGIKIIIPTTDTCNLKFLVCF